MEYPFDIYVIQIALNVTDIFLFTLFIFTLSSYLSFYFFKLPDVTVYFYKQLNSSQRSTNIFLLLIFLINI